MNVSTRVRSGLSRLRTRIKAIPGLLQGVDGRNHGVWHTLFDSDLNTGDWQKDVKIDRPSVMTNWAIFACMTLIASDIGKVSLDLVEIKDGIEIEASSPSFTPVLRKPNPFQTRQQFIETWVTSKLSHGNSYILKVRDRRGVVIKHYVLDPCRVTPLVAPNGAVYYRLGPDVLSEVGFSDDETFVPASEIIHDRMNCLFHPLVGLSPIFASGLAAMQGLKIQQNSAKFFQNMSRPSGVLTAPGQISDETADRLKKHWDENFGGDKIGKVAVLGDDLKYQAMTVTAIDAQLTEQLKASAEMICSTFHVPAFKIGAGTIPAGQKVEDLNQIYYSDCLHALMDAIQTLLIEGLGLDVPMDSGVVYAIRFNLDDLLKMDGATFISTLKEAVCASIMAPNEARRKMNLPKAPGGDAPLSQQQNYSLAALAKRDARDDPFAKAKPAASAPAADAAPSKELLAHLTKFEQQHEAVLGEMRELAKSAVAQQQPAQEVAELKDQLAAVGERFDQLAGQVAELIALAKVAPISAEVAEQRDADMRALGDLVAGIAEKVDADHHARAAAEQRAIEVQQAREAEERSARMFADALIEKFTLPSHAT